MLIATALAFATMLGGVAGITSGGTYTDYCPNPGRAPEGKIYACFHSNDGAPHLADGVGDNSALLVSPNSSNDFAVVCNHLGSTVQTDSHNIDIYDENVLGCIQYSIDGGKKVLWCTDYNPIQING